MSAAHCCEAPERASEAEIAVTLRFVASVGRTAALQRLAAAIDRLTARLPKPVPPELTFAGYEGLPHDEAA